MCCCRRQSGQCRIRFGGASHARQRHQQSQHNRRGSSNAMGWRPFTHWRSGRRAHRNNALSTGYSTAVGARRYGAATVGPNVRELAWLYEHAVVNSLARRLRRSAAVACVWALATLVRRAARITRLAPLYRDADGRSSGGLDLCRKASTTQTAPRSANDAVFQQNRPEAASHERPLLGRRINCALQT